eukprot:1191519-Rhodomonas_salina.2
MQMLVKASSTDIWFTARNITRLCLVGGSGLRAAAAVSPKAPGSGPGNTSEPPETTQGLDSESGVQAYT